MTNEQILKKAIEKAVKNGYDVELSGNGNVKIFSRKDVVKRIMNPLEFIFSHDFAKAFFGLGRMGGNWEVHLQQMVLEKDPIKYLEKFI